MCTNTGCLVEANALTVCFTPRVNLLKLLALGIVLSRDDLCAFCVQDKDLDIDRFILPNV